MNFVPAADAAAERERSASRRATEAPDQRVERLRRRRETETAKRREETEEERVARRAVHRERMTRCRNNETDERRQKRLASEQARAASRRKAKAVAGVAIKQGHSDRDQQHHQVQ